MSKLHIKKGDTVCIIAGESKSQDRSNGTWKTGKVLKVLVKEQKVIVEGFNMISKSTKPNAKNPQGGIIKQEAGGLIRLLRVRRDSADAPNSQHQRKH